jgi:nitroimidazol reductase NimA-like FMN-containing flavoprotein (pyridoxamine 5'-phosphate oxidase superfamily)
MVGGRLTRLAREGDRVPGSTDSPDDAGRVEEFGEEECLALLARGSVGRIVFVDHGQPVALPVNYVLDGRTVAFRTDPGAKLDGATLGRVAFEVDEVDPDRREGWSVLVKGVGRDITAGIDEWSERVASYHLEPWAAGELRHWIAVANPSFSGRRIRKGPR